MKRTGYDADTRQYTFHDSTSGVQFISAPGERYGTLVPAATANYVKPKRGPGRRQTRKYFSLCRRYLPFPHAVQCKRTNVRCSSPTTSSRRNDPLPALRRAATKAPQSPPPADPQRHPPRTPGPLGDPVTDTGVAPPLQISCPPTSSIERRPPSRNNCKCGRCQSRQRRTRRDAVIGHR